MRRRTRVAARVSALVSAADYFRRFNLLLSPRVADFAVRREQRPDRKVG